MSFVLRIGGTSEFVSRIDADDPRCSPPGSIETVAGWDHPGMLRFATREAAELARIEAEDADLCHIVTEEVAS